jgi:hypothetical protein
VEKHSPRSGQAVIEYVMLLLIILTMGGIMRYGVQTARDKLWKKIICDVSAPCPGCAAPASAKNALPKGGSCPK